MKLLITVLALSFGSTAIADEYVNGYWKKDGTYVDGHHRSKANDTKFDNYSTQGNTNPWTGKEGTVDPYKYDSHSYGKKRK